MSEAAISAAAGAMSRLAGSIDPVNWGLERMEERLRRVYAAAKALDGMRIRPILSVDDRLTPSLRETEKRLNGLESAVERVNLSVEGLRDALKSLKAGPLNIQADMQCICAEGGGDGVDKKSGWDRVMGVVDNINAIFDLFDHVHGAYKGIKEFHGKHFGKGAGTGGDSESPSALERTRPVVPNESETPEGKTESPAKKIEKRSGKPESLAGKAESLAGKTAASASKAAGAFGKAGRLAGVVGKAAPFLRVGGEIAGKVFKPLQVATSIAAVATAKDKKKTLEHEGKNLVGSAIGAGIGSLILPGIGTVAGAAIGGWLADKIPDKAVDHAVTGIVQAGKGLGHLVHSWFGGKDHLHPEASSGGSSQTRNPGQAGSRETVSPLQLSLAGLDVNVQYDAIDDPRNAQKLGAMILQKIKEALENGHV